MIVSIESMLAALLSDGGRVYEATASLIALPFRHLAAGAMQEVIYGVCALFFLLALIAVAGWGVEKQRRHKLEALARQAVDTAEQREKERDLAQDELFRRLSDERKLVQEKTQFQAQLAEYEKYAALAQLALGAAHEINNPLLGILSHLELELKSADNGEEQIEIQQCIEGTKRISATIRGLLNYARPGPLLLSKINLDRLVNETLAFLRHQPLLRGIQLENSVPCGLPAIRADANQLSQVLMNLLLNAAQATPPGGTITISAKKVKFEENIEITVADTGCGIAADILPHVFEPFFTTKRGKGTGLGLSICHAYVRSHEGDIRIESLPNRGTRVFIIIPIRQVGVDAMAEQEPAEVVV
jgi:signal transduction histidine kinase